jgi:hypothetical protein
VCERCAEIDEKVARYRALSERLLDAPVPPVLEWIEGLMADLLALKQQFHPTLKE